MGCLGAVLGASWAVLGQSWGPLGRSWSVGKPKRRNCQKHTKKQSLEVKFQSGEEGGRGRESLFDSTVGFHNGRLAARGNATNLMLPWQGILKELRQLEKEGGKKGDRRYLARARSWVRSSRYC